MMEEKKKQVLERLENLKFLTEEEIEKANFFELALYLQNLNTVDAAIKALDGNEVEVNE